MIRMENEDDYGQDATRRLQQRYAKMQQEAQADSQKKAILRKVLDDGAYERVMNVKIANPELYEQLVGSIAYIVQSGRLQGQISEQQILQLLGKMTQRKETSIEFRHK